MKFVDKTSVMVDFSILGDDFDPDIITEMLAIVPSTKYKKGEINKRNIAWKENCWSIDTGYIETIDLKNLIKEIIAKLNVRKTVLIDLKKKFEINYLFIVVMKIEQKEKPVIDFDNEIISFLNDINAEITFDYYIF